MFDGTGAAPAPADVVVDGDTIVHVGAAGTGDGDASIDLTGKALTPGLFDCHVHVMSSGMDILRDLQTPFSYRFYVAAGTSPAPSPPASRASATPAVPMRG